MDLKVRTEGACNLVVKRFMGPFGKYRKWLDKTQWYNKEQLESIQAKLLGSLVTHCYKTVPYYRQMMDERGIKPGNIKGIEDINLFPVFTKKEAREAGERLFSTKYPSWLVRTAYTGGTTGTPLSIQRDLFSIGREQAFVRRQFDWAGIAMNDRSAYLTGRVIINPNKLNGRLYLYDPFMKELILSTYHLSPDTAKEYVETMKRYNVKALVAYASAAYILAKVCIEAGISLKLRAVLTSSETLTDSMRKTISEAFGCGVFDFYGSAERVCYIFTCEKGSYHILPEYGLTELMQKEGLPKGHCKVVSTGFGNWAMPFIRYELGDIVIKSDKNCPCGRAMQVINSIEGRPGDVIRTVYNRQFGTTMLTHLLYGTAHIIESQIIQDALDHITIEYVPSSIFSNADFEALKKLIVYHLPSELKVDLKKVDAVERTSSGKIRPLVSKIA